MKTVIRNAVFGLALAAGAGSAALAQAPGQAPSGAETMFRATTLSLSAFGETRVAPDMATITLGVMTEGKTAGEAMSANTARMVGVMASLRRAGIAERDIQTSNLNLSPQYRYQENQPPILIGYQASNQVTVRVRDLKRLGAAVDATVAAGANNIHGISFGIAEPAAAETAAREAAVKALIAKAELYARATGHKGVRLVSLSEAGGYTPRPPMEMMASARMAKEDVPVAAGEVGVRVDVTGLYELIR